MQASNDKLERLAQALGRAVIASERSRRGLGGPPPRPLPRRSALDRG
ncbi:hypothetical protein [Phenylobacterium sp. J367]|nr:hypothetical protein [Phenylobacterium sp. J367]MCR5878728.1 hypothetical protein [Phenylobacterium sp. J367]